MGCNGWRLCRAMAAFPCSSMEISSFPTATFCVPFPRYHNSLHSQQKWVSSTPMYTSATNMTTRKPDLLMKNILEDADASSGSEFEEESETEEVPEGLWDDVHYPSANELVNNIARFKRTQVSQVVPEVKKWIKEGHPVNKHTLLFVLSRLRRRKRYAHAVRVANWMAASKPVPHETKDDVRRVELHGRCGWYQVAEKIFHSIPDEERDEAAYNAMLLAYANSKMLKKAEYVFEKLKSENMLTSPYTFNLMASLYRRKGVHHKVLTLQEQALLHNIKLDLCFKNILMSAKYEVQGIEEAEKVFNQMKKEEKSLHITSYVSMASCYASAGMLEQAKRILEEIEHGLETGQFVKLRTVYNTLVTLYAKIKNPDGVERAWKELLKLGDPVSNDFICCIKSWGKLGDIQRSEQMFKEAESHGKLKSSPIFSAMLYVYMLLGMTDRAEALVERMKEELAVDLDPWCYFHLTELYVKKNMMEKAIHVLRESEAAGRQARRSRPLPAALALVLDGLAHAEVPDVERAEVLVEEWRTAGYWVNNVVYNKLLLVYVNAKKPVYGFVERMLQDGARPNAKTEILFEELKKIKQGDTLSASH